MKNRDLINMLADENPSRKVVIEDSEGRLAQIHDFRVQVPGIYGSEIDGFPPKIWSSTSSILAGREVGWGHASSAKVGIVSWAGANRRSAFVWVRVRD